MNNLLLVDDDVELTEMMKDYLEQEGFMVKTVADGHHALEISQREDVSLIVLDVMIAGLNGVEVLSRLRMQSQIPVLMLTGRGDEVDRIVGLELGADDYVSKPCSPRELVARIRAILRRAQNSPLQTDTEPLVVGELTVWPEKRHVSWNDSPVKLTSTEFNLLEVLARQAGKVVSKKELSLLGLGRALVPYDRSIDVHLSSIRSKLGELADGRSCIQTVRGVGYQLIW